MVKRITQEELRSGKAKVLYSDEKQKYKVTFEDGYSKVFDAIDCPESMQKGNWFVTLTAEGDRVMGLRPINAMCKAKFSNFVAGEDEIPTPVEREGKYGPYLSFISLLNLGGEYKGMVQPMFLVYKFAEYDGSLVIKGTGRASDMLQSFLEATGIWDHDIPFSDNVLPTLQKMILAENKVFGLTIKDGYVDSIMELPDQDEPEDDFVSAPAQDDSFDNDESFEDEDEDIPF